MGHAIIGAIICASIIAITRSAFSAETYVFARGGQVLSEPRALPSVGVRLDTGRAVLGLHGKEDAVKAACGWYRVIPAAPVLGANQYVASRGYTLNKETATEVVTLATIQADTRTPAQRIGEVLDSMPGADDDARVTALVRAVAVAVTNRMSKSVTITIPAATAAAREALTR